ncbi:MAG: histidinol dehydrogenase [Rhodospirillales bacterium]
MRRYLKQATAAATAERAAPEAKVREMLAAIRAEGDAAVKRFARDLDRWEAKDFRVGPERIREVERQLPETFKEDFAVCLHNVTEFAKRQLETLVSFETEIDEGIVIGQKQIPVNRVGCYIPGGKYPLVSAAIMSVGTARVAGVGHVIGCAPPRDEEGIFPPTLYGLAQAGADEIYCIGGVQAMAAMAYGCVGMNPVDVITGPGNAFVAEAKRQLYGTVGIDLLAGPTEVCVIADASADPFVVATDLVGQAEHGPDSPAWLITTSEELGQAVIKEVERQLETLATRDLAGPAWRDHGEVILVSDADAAIAVSDDYAPEHLELQTEDDDYYLERLTNYGSLFVGEEATVAYGDKGVGTNHTLPTGRAARYTGGLWVGKFIKTVTWQRLGKEASRKIARPLARICEVEGLVAHGISCDLRYDRYAPRNEDEVGR